MKKYFLIAILLIPSIVYAQTDHTTGSWTDWVEVGAMTNCDAGAIFFCYRLFSNNVDDTCKGVRTIKGRHWSAHYLYTFNIFEHEAAEIGVAIFPRSSKTINQDERMVVVKTTHIDLRCTASVFDGNPYGFVQSLGYTAPR